MHMLLLLLEEISTMGWCEVVDIPPFWRHGLMLAAVWRFALLVKPKFRGFWWDFDPYFSPPFFRWPFPAVNGRYNLPRCMDLHFTAYKS